MVKTKTPKLTLWVACKYCFPPETVSESLSQNLTFSWLKYSLSEDSLEKVRYQSRVLVHPWPGTYHNRGWKKFVDMEFPYWLLSMASRIHSLAICISVYVSAKFCQNMIFLGVVTQQMLFLRFSKQKIVKKEWLFNTWLARF